MPTYDFKCQKCGHEFEWNQKIYDMNPLCKAIVPTGIDPGLDGAEIECGGETQKMFKSAPPAHFQGPGWAKDGYSK